MGVIDSLIFNPEGNLQARTLRLKIVSLSREEQLLLRQ